MSRMSGTYEQNVRQHDTKSHTPQMIELKLSTGSVFRVLVSRRHAVGRNLMTQVYQVKSFLSPLLNPLAITLLSNHFTQRKMQVSATVHLSGTVWSEIVYTV